MFVEEFGDLSPQSRVTTKLVVSIIDMIDGNKDELENTHERRKKGHKTLVRLTVKQTKD